MLFTWTNTSAQIKPNPIWEKDIVDTCVVIPLGVDFGLCAMPLGWALSDSGCVMLSGCSMIGSNGTDYSTSFSKVPTNVMALAYKTQPFCLLA